VYADNGTYEIVLAIDDGRGGVDTARTTATISNVAPSLAAFSVPTTPLGLTPAGVTVPVSSSVTDPGTVDTHTASLDCGSGVTAQSEVVGETASSACSFSSAGVYSIRLTVRDKDGGVVPGATVIVKNNATAGIAQSPRPLKRLMIEPTTTRNVPRRSTTIHAAPQIRIVITTSMPAAKPRGTAITARKGPTGAASTR